MNANKALASASDRSQDSTMDEQMDPANNETLKALRRRLTSDPTNLFLAKVYWQALSNVKGHDVRTGRHIIEVFRSAALHSSEGVSALARACRELFEVSGDCPRAEYFDQELIRTLRASESEVREADRSAVKWVLERLEG